MQRVLVALATLLCASSAWATPTTGATGGDDVTDETGASTLEVTRTIALWTHGITAAAMFAGSVVYSIRGLQKSDVHEYRDDCESGVAGACSRYEAAERERRVDKDVGGALLLSSLAPLSGLGLVYVSDPARLDPNNRGPVSVLHGTTAALSVATAGLFVHTLKLRSDLSDAADTCFGGDCSGMQDAESDVSRSLALPLIVTGLNWLLSATSTVWLDIVNVRDVSLAPSFNPGYSGATLTGRF